MQSLLERGTWELTQLPPGKKKRDHQLAPSGEWLLYLGMCEDHKVWLLVNPTSRKEAEVRSPSFHENKTLKSWRKERHLAVETNQDPFEKEKSLEPQQPRRNFTDINRYSKTASEALIGPYADKWKESMDIEMRTLLERGTWE